MNNFIFWLKELFLRIKHISVITNQTQYDIESDKLLNECLDNPSIERITDWTITFKHPNGCSYEFWSTSWPYAYGHDHLHNDYINRGVYYTTRYRLKAFLDKLKVK